MAIQFKMVPKKNNLVQPSEIKYFPCAVSNGVATLEDLAELIASRCSLKVPDSYAAVVAFSQVIAEMLEEGKLVKIDYLGTFGITLSGTGTDEPEKLNKNSIKKANLIFKPSAYLKKRLKKLQYQRIR